MSIAWMNRVWMAKGLTGADRLMLLALADTANDQGVCWPSLATLAAKCDVTERSVRRTLRRLEESGFISSEERPGTSSVYQLQTRGFTPDVDAPPTPDAGARPDVDDRTDVDAPPTPDVDAPPPRTPTSPKPSLNHQLNHQFGDGARARGPTCVRQVEIYFDEKGVPEAARHAQEFVDYWEARDWTAVDKRGRASPITESTWKRRAATWKKHIAYEETRNGKRPTARTKHYDADQGRRDHAAALERFGYRDG